MALTQITSALSLSNNGQAPTTPSLVIAVNADGSAIGGGGGGGGSGDSNVNVAEIGGTAVALGSHPAASSIPVALASDQLGTKTKAASLPVNIASDQVVPVQPVGGSTIQVSPVKDTTGENWGPAAGFLTGMSISACDPVLDGGVTSLVLSAVTGGATVYSLALATNAADGTGVNGMLVNLQGLRIPIPAGGFHVSLASPNLNSGLYLIAGSFSAT